MEWYTYFSQKEGLESSSLSESTRLNRRVGKG